ncbi:hypothetical protein C8J57DRAFT_1320607 [Mycena rebaudengoi]|nr:hypothetical protein C8J57DRAFT_1320607 [Mycena rebaudengoi]
MTNDLDICPITNDLVTLRYRNRQIILFVGADNDAQGRLFCFENGLQSLVVQTKELIVPGYTKYLDDPVADELYLSTFHLELEKIKSLIKEFVFGKTNWAYLVTRKDGSYRLIYKHRPIYRITCPAWAPLVPESHISYTKYITAEDREAIWNGQEVDCVVGWNDRWRDFVDSSMKGYRHLRGLDVTYEVLGHIVRDGEIVGIMTEHAPDDRRVEYKDRAIVYAAIALVQSRGLVISLNESTIMIHRGKVRLLGAASVRTFAEDPRGAGAVELYHWKALATMFEELKEHPNPLPPMRCIQVDAMPFLPPPSPEKLFTDTFFYMLVHFTVKPHDDELSLRTDRKSSRKTRLTSSYSRAISRLIPKILAIDYPAEISFIG